MKRSWIGFGLLLALLIAGLFSTWKMTGIHEPIEAQLLQAGLERGHFGVAPIQKNLTLKIGKGFYHLYRACQGRIPIGIGIEADFFHLPAPFLFFFTEQRQKFYVALSARNGGGHVPFHHKAVLRRFSEKTGEEDSSIIRLPQLEISLENYQVKVSGKVIPCTPKEVEILHMLTSNVGQVFSREQILSRVWGYDYFGDTRTVDAHIKRIRQKLPQENVPWALKTVYGVGYRFEVNA